jgi:hypothetical protein
MILYLRTLMDENIYPMVPSPVHLFGRVTRNTLIVKYPEKVHRSV